MAATQSTEATAQPTEAQEFPQDADQYRRELLAHCYRMLGSVPDAEDALQDALLGAWRGLGAFERRSSLRSWLYTVATNACLKALRRRPRRVLPIDYGPASDPHERPAEPLVEAVWVDPVPDDQLLADADAGGPAARYERRESVELAFIAALQHLPPRQRAVLILRDVLGFSAREAGEVLDTEPAAVDSALQRAHKTVDAGLPRRASRRRCVRSTTPSCGPSWTATWRPGSAPTSTRSSRCWPRT
jgi:RNA polymerase sigma-70 factor, ECF subfamily